MCLFIDGYSTDEVIYQWQAPSEAAVDIYDDVTLSQFDIVSIWTKNNTYSNAIGRPLWTSSLSSSLSS